MQTGSNDLPLVHYTCRQSTVDSREFSQIPLTLVLEFVESGLMVTFKFNNAIFPV
jgi:hypothetical protein